MLYLNDEHMRQLGIHWGEAVDVAEQAALLLHRRDYAQPIKPYLRYRDPVNRIIAMPAFAGERFRRPG
ncbi:hypothetical protein [Paenibacillus protaetiae]|uniref:hypothetical protein n=1 Tax=Paenibacillus protaetiae TaxID=2509456 RepID=UPI001FC9D206|nr:hypothetical protein [Paenibacillus protaetiae]